MEFRPLLHQPDGDGECIPDFARREALLVANQLEQLLLLGTQHQLLLLRLRGELLRAGPDTLQGEQEPFGAIVEPTGQSAMGQVWVKLLVKCGRSC